MNKDKKLTQAKNAIELVRKSLKNKDYKGFRRNQLINTCEDAKKFIMQVKKEGIEWRIKSKKKLIKN